MTRLPLLLLALALPLAACGEKPVTTAAAVEPFTLLLDYFPNADHAGLYAAQAAGEFERARLDIELKTPPDPAATLKLLEAGQVDAAISYEPELLLARDKGLDLVSVATLVHVPLTALISVGDDPVREPADLRGKRVGTAGIPYQAAYLDSILRAAGVPRDSVDVIDVGFNLTPAMLSGKVDATLGAFWNYEGTDLELKGRNPSIIRMEEAGVPTYDELVLVVRRRDLDADGAARIRRLLLALARGHEALRRDPEPGLKALLAANPDLERELQAAVIERTTPLFFPPGGKRGWGAADRDQWAAYGRWMHERGLVEREPDAARAFTNEFLPGQGLDPEPAGLD